MFLNYTSYLDNIETINPSFDKGILKIAYHGKNRNNSFISKEAFEKAIPSMFNCPVVTNYQKDKIDENGEKGDFGSHDAHLEIEKDDTGNITNIDYVVDTDPIGLVPESAKYWWEEIEDVSGLHEYLCTDVILWKRQQGYEKLKKNKIFNHSMEIEIKNGQFNEDGYYDIKDFTFSAFCILSNSVEPCFESSSIELFNKQKFKEEFTQMIVEFKELLKGGDYTENTQLDTNYLEGGNKLDEKLELIQKYNFTQEQIKEKGINFEEISLEDLESKLQEFTTNIDKNNDEPKSDFALTAMQLVSELDNILAKEKYVDKWGWESRAYWYVDHTEEFVVAEDSQDRYNLVKFDFTVDGDKVAIDFNTKRRAKVEYLDLEVDAQFEFNMVSKQRQEYEVKREVEEVKKSFNVVDSEEYQKLNGEFTSIKEENDKFKDMFETMKSEFENLKSYKEETEKVKKESLFNEFENTLSEDEMKELKDKMNELTFEAIQKELFALAGKKAIQFSKEGKPNIGVTFEKIDEKTKSNKSYADLIEKHRKSK